MNKTKRSIKKAVIFIIIAIVVVVVCFLTLIFSNSSYSAKQYKFSNNVLNKIIEAQKSGTTVSFNTEELNESIVPFIKDTMTSDNVSVRGVNAEVKDSTLKFYIPSSYKNFKFLLTTEGKVSYNSGNIVYDPVYFKVGKISIPKSYVINELSGRLGDSVRIQDNKINVSSELLPIKIKSIDIKGGQLNIHTDTTSMTIQERLNWFNNVMKQSGNTGTVNKFIEKFMDGSSLSSVIKSNNSTNLNMAAGSSAEVISEISSAISNRDESTVGSIEAKYNKLPPKEQEKVRSALNSMVGSDNMSKIMEQLNK